MVLPFLLAACGEEPTATAIVPAQAEVAPEQIAEATKHGVPVEFENHLGMRFVLVPAGTFRMGTVEGPESECCPWTPHRVTLTQPYYMQTTEVTNAQYRAMNRGHDSGEHEGHALNGEPQPVVRVTWEQADAFVRWLSEEDAERTYALPTEAQWEHACRAGTTGRYWFGDQVDPAARSANALDESAIQAIDEWDEPTWPQSDGHVVSAPVASFAPNPWGIYDTAGNVWEWCHDVFQAYAPEAAVDPSGPPDGPMRIMRGGSFVNGPERLRSGERAWMYPEVEQPHIGFRLVSPLPQPSAPK